MAESPDCVNVTRYFAPSSSPTSTAAQVTAPPVVCGLVPSRWIRSRPWSSVASMMRAMVRTAWIGHAPTLVSPDSMIASAPSRTALAQSEASARVGREFSIIDSSTWVATITGLAVCAGDLDGALLDQRHVLERQLDAEVAAGDHHAVERVDDLAEVVDRLRLLDLGDDGQPLALLVHDLVHVVEVGAPSGRRTAR